MRRLIGRRIVTEFLTGLVLLIAVAALLMSLGAKFAVAGPVVRWVDQLGSTYQEECYDVVVDGDGYVYVTGDTWGNLGGADFGSADVFVAKYDSTGQQLWIDQFGTPANDHGRNLALDDAGHLYIAGFTLGNLTGGNYGGADAFLTQYDLDGHRLWSRQLGTSEGDHAYGVAVSDTGFVYVVGHTEGALATPNGGESDIFLAKYDATGTLLKKVQRGTADNDLALGVAVDSSGDVYVSGRVEDWDATPVAGVADVILDKYDADCQLQWSQRVDSSADDWGVKVAVDDLGGVYLVGGTDGALGDHNFGGKDAFLMKYDADGHSLWTTQFGSQGDDFTYDVVADARGGIYISGWTNGDLGGPNAGSFDAFVSSLDSNGNLLWTGQFGTPEWEEAKGVAAFSPQEIYFSGFTAGSWEAPNAGHYDGVLVAIVPEPGTGVLLLAGSIAVVCCTSWNRRRR